MNKQSNTLIHCWAKILNTEKMPIFSWRFHTKNIKIMNKPYYRYLLYNLAHWCSSLLPQVFRCSSPQSQNSIKASPILWCSWRSQQKPKNLARKSSIPHRQSWLPQSSQSVSRSNQNLWRAFRRSGVGFISSVKKGNRSHIEQLSSWSFAGLEQTDPKDPKQFWSLSF